MTMPRNDTPDENPAQPGEIVISAYATAEVTRAADQPTDDEGRDRE